MHNELLRNAMHDNLTDIEGLIRDESYLEAYKSIRSLFDLITLPYYSNSDTFIFEYNQILRIGLAFSNWINIMAERNLIPCARNILVFKYIYLNLVGTIDLNSPSKFFDHILGTASNSIDNKNYKLAYIYFLYILERLNELEFSTKSGSKEFSLNNIITLYTLIIECLQALNSEENWNSDQYNNELCCFYNDLICVLNTWNNIYPGEVQSTIRILSNLKDNHMSK